MDTFMVATSVGNSTEFLTTLDDTTLEYCQKAFAAVKDKDSSLMEAYLMGKAKFPIYEVEWFQNYCTKTKGIEKGNFALFMESVAEEQSTLERMIESRRTFKELVFFDTLARADYREKLSVRKNLLHSYYLTKMPDDSWKINMIPKWRLTEKKSRQILKLVDKSKREHIKERIAFGLK